MLFELQEYWRMQPVLFRLYMLYLGFVVCVAAMRWVTFLWQVQRGRRLHRVIALPDVLGGRITPIILARLAVGGGLVEIQASGESGSLDDHNKVLRILALATSEFEYLWNRYSASIQTTKRTVVFVLLSCSAFALHEAVPTFRRFYNNSNEPGSLFVIPTIDQTLWRLSLGFTVAAFLYAGVIFLESTLIRRKITWDHFCSILRNSS